MQAYSIIPIISTYFKSKPIETAWLFGSYARGEATDESDVDILVRFTENNDISLFDHAGMMVDLEDLLEKKVDLVEDGYLRPFAVKSAEKDKILIYERAIEG
jgi:predicted nucleotidyltransferase